MASSSDQAPACLSQLAPVLKDMATAIDELHRLGRALNAVASITTSGNPQQTDLGVLSSEDLGALLATLADQATNKTQVLDRKLRQAIELSRRPTCRATRNIS